MNWLLFVILFLFTLRSFLSNGKLILHPAVLPAIMFTLSSLLLALNPEWKYEISLGTIVYIVFALLSFSFGIKIGVPQKTGRSNPIVLEGIIIKDEVNPKLMFLVSAICVFVTYKYAQNQYAASVMLGNNLGWAGVILTLRGALNYDTDVFQLSTSLNLGISFTRAISYTSLFLLISSLINKTGKWKLYVVPILCMFANIILATGRGGFINVIATIIFDIYIICRLKGVKNIERKITKYSAIGLGLFLAVFLGLGTLTGKNEVLSTWDAISIYIGSSILCLDYLINHGSTSPFTFLGMHTFKGLYGLFARFIPGLPTLGNHAEMVRWSDYSSNVYTSFGPYITDYGLKGSLFILLLAGFIFSRAWYKLLRCTHLSVLTLVYGRFFGYALCMSSIAERLFSEYLALNVLVELFIYVIILKYCIKQK